MRRAVGQFSAGEPGGPGAGDTARVVSSRRDLAVDGFHGWSGIAVAGNFVLREGGFELGDFFGCELDIGGGGVFFEIFSALGAGDGDHVLALG
jgi:hypothetical protein